MTLPSAALYAHSVVLRDPLHIWTYGAGDGSLEPQSSANQLAQAVQQARALHECEEEGIVLLAPMHPAFVSHDPEWAYPKNEGDAEGKNLLRAWRHAMHAGG